MQFVSIPTEQVAAITDFMLAVLALVLSMYLHKFSHLDRLKVRLWQTILIVMIFSSLVGASFYGIVMQASVKQILKYPMNGLIIIMVVLFLTAAIYDGFGVNKAKRAFPFLLGLASLVFIVAILNPSLSLLVLLYSALAMLMTLILYVYLTLKQKFPGGVLISLGLIVNLLASAVRAKAFGSIMLNFGLPLNHNGVYHIGLIIGGTLLIIGITKSLQRSDRAAI